MTSNKPEIKHPQAPPFNKRHMVIARRTTEELYVYLSLQEALERGQEAAEKLKQARALADALAAHAKQVKADIKALENRAQHLQEQCRIEAELAPVECDVVFDYNANEAYTVRRDTNQEIRNSRRTLQPSEIQHFQTTMDTHMQSVPLAQDKPADIAPFVPMPTPEESEAWAALHSEPWDTGAPEHDEDDGEETATHLQQLISEILGDEDDYMDIAAIMRALEIDDDDEQSIKEVEDELAAGLSSSPPVYGRNDDGDWGLAEWDAEITVATTDPALRDEILAILGVAGSKGVTNTALAKSLGQDLERIDVELDALKRDGLATGRGGRGKRWHAVTREAE